MEQGLARLLLIEAARNDAVLAEKGIDVVGPPL